MTCSCSTHTGKSHHFEIWLNEPGICARAAWICRPVLLRLHGAGLGALEPDTQDAGTVAGCHSKASPQVWLYGVHTQTGFWTSGGGGQAVISLCNSSIFSDGSGCSPVENTNNCPTSLCVCAHACVSLRLNIKPQVEPTSHVIRPPRTHMEPEETTKTAAKGS